MEAAGLGLAVYATCKEVFLLSRALYKLIQSAKAALIESHDIHVQFYHEIVFLQAFGNQFLASEESRNLLGNELLNCVGYDLNKLEDAFRYYARLAAAQDDAYKDWSPRLHAEGDSMKAEEALLLAVESPSESNSWLTPTKNALLTRLYSQTKAIKWAVSDRRKFEKTLQEFQKWNGYLKGFALMFGGIVLAPQLYTQRSSEQLPASASASTASRTNINVQKLELEPHFRIRELAERPELDDKDYNLEDVAAIEPIEQSQSLATISISELTICNTGKAQRQPVLVELKEYASNEVDGEEAQTLQDVQSFDETQVHQLASMLASADQTNLHTLPLKGYLRQDITDGRRRYAFIYNFPKSASETTPTSLYELISSSEPSARLSLPVRFLIAHTIATTIGTLHADGWVHKSIRSHNFIFFPSSGASSGFTEPYLIGFEYSRLETAETEATWDDDAIKNLYRHPERQGPPLVTFTKRHDIYALGLVLLEIGLWRTLSDIWEDSRAKVQKRTGKVPALNRRMNVEYFTEAAKHNLSHTMGKAYAKAVLTCLELRPDEDNQETEESQATAFYVNVLRNLDIENLLTDA
ncbi:hypothetical protein MMC26_002658 [Xylographa opegraphella]|nr:hypothetical protein [Xylographa opegraphella]